jgi:hypothetical protein
MMISKITNRMLVVTMASTMMVQMHGAVAPGRQVSAGPILASLVGLATAGAITAASKQELLDTYNNLVSPAPIPQGTSNHLIVRYNQQPIGVARNPFMSDLASDGWKYARFIGCVVALTCTGNAIGKQPMLQNVKPILNSAALFGSSFFLWKNIPRLFTNYITLFEKQSLAGSLLIMTTYLMGKSGLLKRGFDLLSV